MMTYLLSVLSGLVFGLGLIVSEMINPSKVIAFLDLFGMWDPSLAFVMLGAISVGLIGFMWAKKRKKTLLNTPIHLPPKHTNLSIDKRLIGGSLLFGAGWGLAGFCPGPALVSLSLGIPEAAIFVASMLVGMSIFAWIHRKS
jgi:uncharacterized membrane protein YedE/YeeE